MLWSGMQLYVISRLSVRQHILPGMSHPYNVQCTSMKRYTVAQMRERLAEALNEAERGVPVVIERRGVRYVLRVERAQRRPRSQPSVIETLDSSVAQGRWQGTGAPQGLL